MSDIVQFPMQPCSSCGQPTPSRFELRDLDTQKPEGWKYLCSKCQPLTEDGLRELLDIRDKEIAALTSLVERKQDGPYLVWSNEHRCWWRPERKGYTLHVQSAGRYSRADAIEIARGSRNGWAEGRAPDEIAVAERDVMDQLLGAFSSEQSRG